MTLPAPDPGYHIDAAARLRLKPGVDADALERLLQHFSAESRPSHLEMFSVHEVMVHGDVIDTRGRRLIGAQRAPDVTVLVRISHPVLQQLLEEVWQPYWAALSDVEPAVPGGPPGRELALRRRAEQTRG